MHKQSGWSDQEAGHTWTNAPTAELTFQIKDGAGKELVLDVKAFPFLKKGLTAQPVKVLANGVQVAEWSISKEDMFKADIPASVMKTDELNVRFEIAHPSSPKENGFSDDARMLGMAVTQVCITKQE